MKKPIFMLLFVLASLWGMAQNITVTGTVTDEAKSPLPGVTIAVKGTTIGTVTDIDGKYLLKVSDPNATISVSVIGRQAQEIALAGRTTVDVTLAQEMTDIDEVVVVGYGSQTKESVVGAISTISSDEIVQTPTANLTSGLAGKMPGLTIMVQDGELGKENINMYIRGQATTNNTSPLILVDGVERELSTLDPYDVENISILKDASATAVFGVRGANGVILVTTKKGMVGKPEITANANYSMQTPTRMPRPMNVLQFMETRNGVIKQHNEYTGGETALPYSDELIDYYRNGYDPSKHPSWYPEYYVDRNWYKELMHDFVPMYKGNVNLRGGTEKTKYFASVGYMKQGGPFKTESWDEYNYDNEVRLNRFTYRANVDMQITDDLKAWVNLSGYLQDKNDPIIYGAPAASASTASYYYLMLAAFSDMPAMAFPDTNSEGQVVSIPGKDRTPYGMLNRSGYRVTTNNTINSTLGFQYNLGAITKGLSAKAVVSYDSHATHIRGFRRTYITYNAQVVEDGETGEEKLIYTPGAGTPTELSPLLTQSYSTNFDLEASLNYARKFGAHDVTGLMLYKQNQRVVNNLVQFNYVGVVCRATYGYDKKYLAEFNFGMNGSEQYATGNRFGFFPSLSLGWVLSQEDFLRGSQAIEFLKIRTSFGQVGNDKISGDRFLYVENWTQGSGDYFQGMGNLPGLPAPVYEASIPNQFVMWEVANKANVGIESRFLDGFEWDVDLFYEKRSSILTIVTPIPAYMYGQKALPPRNDGIMTNRGFESTLGYSKSVNKDWFVGARFSASFARNTIEAMNETPLDETYAYPYRTEGFSRATAWGYDCLGYFANDDEITGWADMSGLGANVMPGDLKYRDVNGDGVIDTKDYVPMDHPTVPEWNYSLTLSTQYKGIDFSVLLHAVNNYTYNLASGYGGRGVYDWQGNDFNGIKNYFDHHEYAWTAEKAANGGDIRYPRMHFDGISVSKQPSNYFLVDLWYMRVKNIELGYTLPKNATKRLGLEKLRVYVNGANVLTFDNMPYKQADPEIANMGLSHPIYSTFNMGLNITF